MVDRVYLVGKVLGNKYKIKEAIKDINFVCSDGSNHSEHDWGWAHWNIDGCEEIKAEIKDRCLSAISNSDYLVAWLDTNNAFGSIAEISFASTIGKTCLVFVENREEFPSDLQDAYWLVSNFPNVNAIECSIYDAIDILNIYKTKKFDHEFKSLREYKEHILKIREKQKKDLIKTLNPEDIEELEELEKREPMSKVILYFKRNKEIVRQLKELYNNKCQICQFTFKKDNGENYSETHHVIPLGENGSDNIKNLIVVCPNCHRQLHYAKNNKYDIKYKEQHYKLIRETD